MSTYKSLSLRDDKDHNFLPLGRWHFIQEADKWIDSTNVMSRMMEVNIKCYGEWWGQKRKKCLTLPRESGETFTGGDNT